MRSQLLVFLLQLLVLLSACGGSQTRDGKLKEAIFYFNEGVRWGRIQDVLARVHPSSVDHFREAHEEFGKAIKITDYEIMSSNVDLAQDRAEVGIQISWYRIDRMELQSTVLVQHWEEQNHEWLMVAEEHRSGTPLLRK